MKLSTHVTIEEFEYSDTAIKKGYLNKMNIEQTDNAIALCEAIFEPLRAFKRLPINITSGFRGYQLNKSIKGSASSQHCKGEAMDIKIDAEQFDFIKENLNFDQLIAEFPVGGKPSWVHVSYSRNKEKQRNEVLIAVKQGGKTKYLPYKGNEKLVK